MQGGFPHIGFPLYGKACRKDGNSPGPVDERMSVCKAGAHYFGSLPSRHSGGLRLGSRALNPEP